MTAFRAVVDGIQAGEAPRAVCVSVGIASFIWIWDARLLFCPFAQRVIRQMSQSWQSRSLTGAALKCLPLFFLLHFMYMFMFCILMPLRRACRFIKIRIPLVCSDTFDYSIPGFHSVSCSCFYWLCQKEQYRAAAFKGSFRI